MYEVLHLVETDPFNESFLRLLHQSYSRDATLYSLQLSTQSLVVFYKPAPRLSKRDGRREWLRYHLLHVVLFNSTLLFMCAKIILLISHSYLQYALQLHPSPVGLFEHTVG